MASNALVWKEKLNEETNRIGKVSQEEGKENAAVGEMAKPGRMYLLSGGCVLGTDGSENQIDPIRPGLCVVLPCRHCIVYEYKDHVELKYPVLCSVPKVKEYLCGHQVLMTCSEYSLIQEEIQECPCPCKIKLNCGHPCPRTRCHIAEENGTEHGTDLLCRFACNKAMCPRNLHESTCSRSHECHEPCPPCEMKIQYKLECGHIVTRLCHEKSPHEDSYICKETCNRDRSNCFHGCEKLCGEDCGPCMCLALRPLTSCPRKHSGLVKCYQKSNVPKDILCTFKVHPRSCKQNCGHKQLQVYCHEADHITTAGINSRCREPCKTLLSLDDSCGHQCSGSCGECFQYRFHKRCEHSCGKTLICNHYCTFPCGAGCPPCPQTCFRACAHKKCERKCGMPCRWECKEKCTYSCPHDICTQPCDQICNKKPCMSDCPVVLVCGHPCVGFCGEPCPPYCRYCNRAELKKGALFKGHVVERDDRFIYLTECGHAIESKSMERWMKLADAEDEEILPRRCPICLTRLGWIHRFSKIMWKNWNLVESVKEHICGKEEDIDSALEDVGDLLLTTFEKSKKSENPFYLQILHRIENMLGPESRSEMYKRKAYFLEWVIDQWRHASSRAMKFELYNYDPDLSLMKGRWEELFEFVTMRQWPLQRAEVTAYYQERKRLDDYTALYSMLSTSHEHNESAFFNLIEKEPGVTLFKTTKKCLETRPVYNKAIQEEFQSSFLKLQRHMNITIQLSEEERLQIVDAFGGKSGHFFKCPNGHVYVITECGGAVVSGSCPDCNARIGGTRHELVEDNALASEMDGAVEPYYAALLRERDALIREEEELIRQQHQHNP